MLHREQVGALHDAQHRHHLTATTLTPATQDNTRGVGDPNSAQAQATWEYPPKVHDTGQVDVPPTTGASATVAIWVDDTGRPVAPPRPGTAIMANAAFAGLGSLAALSTTTLTLYTLRRRTLDRRADRAWEPAWERVEPLWSGRTGHRPGGGDQ
ncbi:hypothetical protein C7C46_09875 [Streptomyces tateyamensis]|uniref:Transmembrane protein n=1 Tax=Streptomyces tateyamensis TaxID=565073 RepID=A0A2V4NRS8_9ACTN|nr:hypothetical protein C7C46_09875 [Streptomyces tateyamensis]